MSKDLSMDDLKVHIWEFATEFDKTRRVIEICEFLVSRASAMVLDDNDRERFLLVSSTLRKLERSTAEYGEGND